MKIGCTQVFFNGKVCVDCSECQDGGNGNGSCETGGQFKLAYRGGCLKGKLMDGLMPIEIKKPGGRGHGKKDHDVDYGYHKESDFWS